MTRGLRSALLRVRAGYSLFEVLVVVAIMGIAATISGPSISRMITAQQAKQVVRGIVTEFGAIRAEAFTQSISYSAEDIEAQLMDATPVGWSVQVSEAANMTASGYCTPGFLSVSSRTGRQWVITISEGDCSLVGSAP